MEKVVVFSVERFLNSQAEFDLTSDSEFCSIPLIIDGQEFSFVSEQCQLYGGQQLSIDIGDRTTSSWEDGELRIRIDYATGGFCSWVAQKI